MPSTISRAALIAGVATLAGLGFLLAQGGELICQPDYDFCVEVDGQYPADARFYRADARGKFFIDIPDLQNGLLLDLKAKKISAVSRDRITRGGRDLRFHDGLPADAADYAFAIDGPIIRFEADDHKVRILRVLDRPPLIGPIGVDALLADRPEYQAGMEIYTPDDTAMKSVSSFGGPIQIEVYFGTWCPHCKKYMPRILRVARDAGNASIQFNMVGVPKSFGTEAGPWQNKGIQTIPTVIVKQAGKEITRMSTHESATPEIELAGILAALP